MFSTLQGEFSGGMWTVWGVLEVKVSKALVRFRSLGLENQVFGKKVLEQAIWIRDVSGCLVCGGRGAASRLCESRYELAVGDTT